MADVPKSGSKSTKSGAMIASFAKQDAESKASLEAFGKGMASLDFEGDLSVGLGDEVPTAKPDASPELEQDTGPAEFELEPEPALELASEDSAPAAPSAGEGDHAEFELEDEVRPPPPQPPRQVRPNLEPVPDEAHPPQNRRAPTQPPGALQLVLDESESKPKPKSAAPSAIDDDITRPISTTSPPPKLPLTRSPSPSPSRSGRQWLFSDDRVTNLLAGAAIGLAVMIFPAKKIARGYEVSEVEPMLADLDGAIDHPLGVDAGLVEKPEAIAAKIEDGRKSTRRRYLGIWLLVGLPIGLGLGFVPKPGA